MEENVMVSRQDAQDIANMLSVSSSPIARSIAAKLTSAIGGWKPLPTLRGGFGDVSVGSLIELRSLDGRTGSVAVAVQIPGQDPSDCLCLLETRDGSPCFIPHDQYSGWRCYQFDEDPSK